MRLVDSPLQFGDADIHEVSLYDRRDEFGLFNPGRDAAGRIERDHGLALRFPNPYNPLSTVAILAGSFGHGTHAAAQLVCHHGQAIVAPVDCAEDGFGLLLQTDVIDNWPLSPKILRSSRVSDRARRG